MSRFKCFATTARTKTRAWKPDEDEDEDEDEDFRNVCFIGTILSFGHGTVTMRSIDPDAFWGDEPFTLDLDEIHRLDFGGGYEDALLLVSNARDEPASTD